MNQVSFDRIRELLPQTYPMLMVDRIHDWTPGCHIRAVRSISGNDPLINGHFRNQAIVPGALIIEGIAQCALLLLMLSEKKHAPSNATFVLGSVKARFLRPVTPGDQLVYDVTLDTAVAGGALFRGNAFVDDAVVASCELLVAITQHAAAPESEAVLTET